MGSVVRATPAALPPGKTRCPLYSRLGGHQGQPERSRKNSLPPGFDPRTTKPVASRYTDCAIPACIVLTDVIQGQGFEENIWI
jgi:hypothetical protein